MKKNLREENNHISKSPIKQHNNSGEVPNLKLSPNVSINHSVKSDGEKQIKSLVILEKDKSLKQKKIQTKKNFTNEREVKFSILEEQKEINPQLKIGKNEISHLHENELIDESYYGKNNEKPEGKKKKKKDKSKKMYEMIEPNSMIETVANISSIKMDDIFGEKIELEYDRLRKISPFGNFETWKIYKLIVKNGEDLRQEQFATQLINEFFQIFQLEEVKIFLKPYEILSTGQNVGLIEGIPNAVSIDHLKKKIKNMSLANFFETYFGPVNSESKRISVRI